VKELLRRPYHFLSGLVKLRAAFVAQREECETGVSRKHSEDVAELAAR